MRPVEHRGALVGADVLDGLRTVWAGADADAHAAGVQVRQRLLEGVGRQEGETIHETPFQTGLEGIVIGGCAGFQHITDPYWGYG